MRKSVYFSAVTITFLALLMLTTSGFAQVLPVLTGDCPDIEVVDSFHFPDPIPGFPSMTPTVHGLAFRKIDRSLWGAEYNIFEEGVTPTGKIHKFRENNGVLEIEQTIDVTGFNPTGVTFESRKIL